MKDQAADVENTLRTAGFSRPVVSTEQIPAKQKEELEEQIRQIEQTIADIRGEIISYAEDREELKIIGDYYRRSLRITDFRKVWKESWSLTDFRIKERSIRPRSCHSSMYFSLE